MDNLKFSALLCSRLCHDLVSPVGALNNGIEILADETDPGMIAQAAGLLEQSARQTSNRLKFYRLAFGAAGGFGSIIGLREAHEAMEALFSDAKVELDFDPGDQTLAVPVVKLMLNLALVAGEAIIRGGNLAVEVSEDEGGLEISCAASANRIIVQKNIRRALLGELPEEELEPKSAPAFLAALIAGQLESEINIQDESDTHFLLTVEIGTPSKA